MKKRRLLWQLYPAFFLTILISLFFAAWYATSVFKDFHRNMIVKDLEARAKVLFSKLPENLMAEESAEIDRLCRELGTETGSRFTIILPDGQVIGDSEEDPARMDNHRDRPEVIEAFAGRTGSNERYSHTLKQTMSYVAVPYYTGSREAGTLSLQGIVRVAVPIEIVQKTLNSFYLKIMFGGIIILIIASIISLISSRRIIIKPLEKMVEGAEKFAGGDLNWRLEESSTEEVSALADAMNKMAVQLNERIDTFSRQKNEQEAILSSMVEGVVAVNNERKVININKAAADLLDTDLKTVIGQNILEVIRNLDLQDFVDKILEGSEPVEGEIVLRQGDEDRFLQSHGTRLRDGSGKSIGALVVLNDITNIKRLENVRRDFVANVSHELKTPITSIRGFVETLLDDDRSDQQQVIRFLNIILKQVDRLNAIVDDLLNLSRIERGSEKKKVELIKASICNPVRSAVQTFENKASQKGIKMVNNCPEDIEANINTHLLEQALLNLIDNAIKYSESGTTIQVFCGRKDREVLIQVVDQGAGIGKEHLSRLFERFYRVDKARSREQGGTGLGLAIVKHIALAHNGTVSVQSEPGKGSTFTISIPDL